MNSGQPPLPPLPSRKIQVNPSAEFYGQLFNWKLRPTLGMNSGQPDTLIKKDSGEPSAEF